MKTIYQFYPSAVAAAISTPERQSELSAKFADCAPASYIDALSLHPELLAGLLLDGSVPFEVLGARPELTLQCFVMAEDKWAFARLVAPHLAEMPEAMSEQFVLVGRRSGLPDSLLDEALANIVSPWRLKALGYVRRAADNRRAMASTLEVSLTKYIEGGACLEREFEAAACFKEEELWEYCRVRLHNTPRSINEDLLDGVSGRLAYNLLTGPTEVVRMTNVTVATYMNLQRSMMADPLWALEFVLRKHSDQTSKVFEEDLAYYTSPRALKSIESEQAREEVVKMLNRITPQRHVPAN